MGMRTLKSLVFTIAGMVFLYGCQQSDHPSGLTKKSNAVNNVELIKDQLVVTDASGTKRHFSLAFTLLYRNDDPEMALRPAEIEGVKYNVPTWKAYQPELADLKSQHADISDVGDGFDPSILGGKTDARTVNYYHSAKMISVTPEAIRQTGDTINIDFGEHALFTLKARVSIADNGYPHFYFVLMPKQSGFFSVGYTGAPAVDVAALDELWQPLIWQEKVFPDKPYLTLAYRTPLPTTLVRQGSSVVGVLADPEELPFQPLPLADNSRFGVMLHNQNGEAQPQLFAPVLGGIESQMNPGDRFGFSFYLVAENNDRISETYEHLARELFGFGDYRHNDIASLNTTLENIVDYALSEYAWFVDDLKGAAYSTDVPGAVKNVSSLNALELAMVTDNPAMFEKRAYPTIEYMLSREKFLFSLDPEQKIQHPSRNLHGPIAPISELTALYSVLGEANPFFIELAKEELGKTRVRNLDVEESGDNWRNAMWLYKATREQEYLDQAVEGAREYIAKRVAQPKNQFVGSGFFWPDYTPKFIELSELYELTRDKTFLDAAHEAARQYTMFIWMSPKVPDQNVLVNPDGKAPMYWYLQSKGHKQMHAKEAWVAPWRLSEIGLTAESSGTSSGHRAIFMANYAPWLMRIGHYADDKFLQQVAKAAIIGRYRNFPGYHINTARTNIYEQESYPLQEHKALSVNSFHYNHILPSATMLLDYMVADAQTRSNDEITFPSQYIEGYAYLQNKFYGQSAGKVYDNNNVYLWMPEKLVQVSNVELNYISGYDNNNLYLIFTNQSQKPVHSNIHIDKQRVAYNSKAHVTVWQDNRLTESALENMEKLTVDVSPNGITVLKIEGAKAQPAFSQSLRAPTAPLQNDYVELPELGNARAMLIKLGDFGTKMYLYLRDDDSAYKSTTLSYMDNQGETVTLTDNEFPFEFTVSLPSSQRAFNFHLSVTDKDGRVTEKQNIQLGGS